MLNPLPIALIVGLGAGLLTYLGTRWMDRRLSDSRKYRGPIALRSLGTKLPGALKFIPIPNWILSYWDDPLTDQQLIHANLQWSSLDFVRVRWGLLWAGLMGAFWIGFSRGWDVVGSFFACILLVSGVYGPRVWLQWKIERNQIEADLILPDFLDRLILGLNAGLGFELALRRAALTFPNRVGREVRRSLRQIDRGHARSTALGELKFRLPSQDVGAFVAAVNQSDRLGTPLVKVLRVQSELLRSRRRRHAQEASRRLPILIIFPLVFFFLPALLIIYLAPPLLMLFLQR